MEKMEKYTIEASFIPETNTYRCAMPTAYYKKWLQEEGQLFKVLSEEVIHHGAITIITLPTPWFDVCKRYSRILVISPK